MTEEVGNVCFVIIKIYKVISLKKNGSRVKVYLPPRCSGVEVKVKQIGNTLVKYQKPQSKLYVQY